MILTRNQILDTFSDAGCKRVVDGGKPHWGNQLLERWFEPLSLPDLEDGVRASVSSLPKELKNRRGNQWYPKYLPVIGNCNNVSLWLLADLQKIHAVKAARKDEMRQGIAVFLINYHADNKEDRLQGNHTTVAYINTRGNLRFYEFLLRKPIRLTRDELESLWFAFAG